MMTYDKLRDFINGTYGGVLNALQENYYPFDASDAVQERWGQLDDKFQDLMTDIGYFEDELEELASKEDDDD